MEASGCRLTAPRHVFTPFYRCSMNFKETEDQRAIRATVRDFAEKEILPHRMEWDEGQVFPRALFSKMG